jgi:type VI secretion system protein ImpL
MINLLKSGVFWTLFIAFIVSMLIIFVFPFYFEDYEVLSYRLLIAFAVFFITLTLVLLYVIFLQERTQAYLKKRRERIEKEKERRRKILLKINDIKIRFHEAIKIIKRSSLYRRIKKTKYELPWYLVVGKNDAGKTSLIEASGLDFPLNTNFQDQKVMEVGFSEAFQWYFAEHAVFIDMPGHYVEQKQNEEDPEVWNKGFLKIFAQKRAKRPINGIMLNISVDTFMEQSERELIEYAKELRDRFDELSKGFVASIPIYLVVTKSDLIPGYNEYFATITDDEKDEVLGITFDDPNENISTKVLGPKFEDLLKRLNSSILDKLHDEWDEVARSKIFLFCDSFSNLFEKINIFTDICFAQTSYRQPLMLRGIYFTSIPKAQEVSNANLFASKQDKNNLSTARDVKGLFIKKLLEDIIFPEADLISMDKNYRKRSARNQSIAMTVSIALVCIFSFFLVDKFLSHNNLLHQLEKDYIQYEINKN